jgi:hypothetical protein
MNAEFLDARNDLEIYEEQTANDLLDLDKIYCVRTVIDCAHHNANEDEGSDS